MKKTLMVLLLAAVVVAATGIVNARIGGYYSQQAADDNWYNYMYRWMGQHMGGFGHMMGYGQYDNAIGVCPGFGAGYYQDAEAELITLEEATQLLEEAVDGTFTSEVYQMGPWYVVFYEDSDKNRKQARLNMFTGTVYTDFYEYMSENTGMFNSRGYRGMGGMMWGY